jgi:phosphoglycerate kinase
MSFLKKKRSVDDIWPMYNKAVLVRVDLNVRVRNGVIAKSKDQRIRAVIPTIRRIIDQGGKAILMSHMGRPTGHKFSALRSCDEKKRRYLQIWSNEAGSGCTTFFSLRSGEDKKKILSWSSVSELANAVNETEGAGKTDLFAALSNDEKRSLLNRFQTSDDRYCNFVFPHLRTYNGFEDELTLRPVAVRLSELLNESGLSPRVDVKFAEDCLNADEIVASLEPGQVLLLENVRFYSDENSRKGSERRIMAQRIASYGDYFVSDGEHLFYPPPPILFIRISNLAHRHSQFYQHSALVTA